MSKNPSIQPESKHLAVKDLEFDPLNPRFFSQDEGLTEQEIVEKMLDHESVLELVLSIGEKGFYEGEPLLVVPSKRNGKYTVVEGNRRLTALKLLTDSDLLLALDRKTVTAAVKEANKAKIPANVPCLLFRRREDTLEYLGFRHITGAKPWGPLAKAKFLKQLEQTLTPGLSLDAKLRSLAKTIGSQPKTVRELLVSYGLYELIEKNKFFEIENLTRETLEFGVFYTAIKDSTIFKHIGAPENPDEVASVNISNLRELTKWLFEKVPNPVTGKPATRLGESRNLVSLSRVLRNPIALKAFREDKVTLKVAADIAGEQLDNFEKATGIALEHIKQASVLVNAVGEKLDKQHSRITSALQVEAEDLHDRVRKKVRINEDAKL